MQPTRDGLRQRFEKWSSEQLLTVLHPRGGYTDEAAAIARGLLEERGVDVDEPSFQEAMHSRDQEFDEADQEANEPLSVGARIACVVFSVVLMGFPAMVIAAYSYSQGRKRKGEEALRWMVVGWGVWFVWS
jgi:hypothetical protein